MNEHATGKRLRRWLAITVLPGGFLLGPAALRPRSARVVVANEPNQQIRDVASFDPGGVESCGQIAPGSQGVVRIPHRAIRSLRPSFRLEDGATIE